MPNVLDCSTPIALAGYESVDDCNDVAGVTAVALTEYSSVDWDGSTIADGVLSAYTMNDTETFFIWETDPENTFFTSEWSEDTMMYESVLTGFLRGLDSSQRQAVLSLAGKCLVAHLFLTNCSEVILGADQNAAGIVKPIKPLKPSRHLLASGQIGQGDRARTELEMMSRSLQPPLMSTVGLAALPLP